VSKLDILVLPITLEFDGCYAHLLEVLKHEKPNMPREFTAVVSIECGNIRTRPFSLTCRTNDELKAKIEAEITKLKYAIMLYGEDFVREMVTR